MVSLKKEGTVISIRTHVPAEALLTLLRDFGPHGVGLIHPTGKKRRNYRWSVKHVKVASPLHPLTIAKMDADRACILILSIRANMPSIWFVPLRGESLFVLPLIDALTLIGGFLDAPDDFESEEHAEQFMRDLLALIKPSEQEYSYAQVQNHQDP